MPGDLTYLPDGTVMTDIHDPGECEGRGCWVHHASAWPLNQAPVVWDAETRRAYRRCQHGRLHWDRDDHAWATRYSARHAAMPLYCCPDDNDCGCCEAWADE